MRREKLFPLPFPNKSLAGSRRYRGVEFDSFEIVQDVWDPGDGSMRDDTRICLIGPRGGLKAQIVGRMTPSERAHLAALFREMADYLAGGA